MRKPVLMLTNTSSQWEVVGQPIRADGFFGNTDGLHTVSLTVKNFIGGFRLQGTLSLTPTEEDWFDIVLQGYNCCVTDSTVRFPLDEFQPTGDNGGDSGTIAFTFIGNFTMLRARQERTYISELPPNFNEFQNFGVIDRVLLSL